MDDSLSSPGKIYKDSAATRAKKSASAKKRANTTEGKAILSQNGSTSFKGHAHTEETKAIIRAKRAQQIISRESLEKTWSATRGRPSPHKGIPQTEEAKKKISKTLRSKRDHLSQKAKDRYERETEEQRSKRLNPWIAAGHSINDRYPEGSSLELFLAQQLDILGVEYKRQERIGYYIVDFYIPANNLIINVDGCYWHGCEKCGFNSPKHIAKRRADQNRYHYLVRKGYMIKSLWEHTIRKAMANSSYVLHLAEWLAIL